MAEAVPLRGPLDEPGQIGQGERAEARGSHDPEVGGERRERVVGDLRPRPGEAGEEGRLAGVGEADEAGVGEELQLEREPQLLAVFALLGEARRSARVRQEARALPRPPLTATRRDPLSPCRTRSASSSLSGPYTTVPSGTSTTRSAPPTPCLLLSAAVRARARLAVRVIAEREQRRDVAARAQPHVAATTAVATVGAAARHVRTRVGTRRSPRRRRHPSRCTARHRRTRTSGQDTDRASRGSRNDRRRRGAHFLLQWQRFDSVDHHWRPPSTSTAPPTT